MLKHNAKLNVYRSKVFSFESYCPDAHNRLIARPGPLINQADDSRGVEFSPLSVCFFQNVQNDISKTDAAIINKLDIEMIYDVK